MITISTVLLSPKDKMRFFTEVAKIATQHTDETSLEYLAAIGIILAGAGCLGYTCYCWDMGLWWAPEEEYERNLTEHIICCCGSCLDGCCCGEEENSRVLGHTSP
jgi:hypothetical protein